MKRRICFVLMPVFICLICCSSAFAFSSGSTGSLGALTVASDTTMEISLPSDGVLNYTTITIPATSTVKFKNNAANTPIYVLATSDVQIAGTVDVSGSDGGTLYYGVGGPGGFDGGNGGATGQNVSSGGKGMGPGGGGYGPLAGVSAGTGGGGGGFGTSGAKSVAYYSTTYGQAGGSYGNAKVLPMIGGSGGGGGAGSPNSIYLYTGGFGGGGGGAILIASSTSISITGAIKANGGNGGKSSGTGTNAGTGGGGSGGAIKLMANKISGSGTVTASAGYPGSNTQGYPGGAGGAGRIRFETTDLTAWTGTINPMTVYSYAVPGTVFVSNIPTLTITSVNGINVPSSPSGKFGTPDITLPSGTSSSLSVEVTGTNIPVNTQVTLSSVPEYGSATNATGTLTGTDASSTTSVSISLSTSYQCILMAQATFAVQTAMYYDNERIDRVRVASTMGGQSQAVYITEKGREIPAEMVMARMME